MPSPRCTASASSPDYDIDPPPSVVPLSKLRLHLDLRFNQHLLRADPSDNFIGSGASYFSVCFPPSVVPRSAGVDVGAVASSVTAGPVLLPSMRKPRKLECHRLSDMKGVSCQPTSIY